MSLSTFVEGLQDVSALAATGFAASVLLPTGWIRLKTVIEQLSATNNKPEIRSKRSLLHDKFSLAKVPEDLDYIVIGSGMGGLTCAAILARLGRKVLVLEQHNDVAGGGTHMFDIKGYRFDSGLHYTVPWSMPLFALTCLKKPADCLPFDLMTEEDGTIDKIYLVEPNEEHVEPFRMKYKETHMQQLYEMFPEEKAGIDQFLEVSTNSMHYVKFFLLSKLFPKWLQNWYWSLVPSAIVDSANITAKELLPRFIQNKKLISLFSSMWIDTGARPDQATFMLTASVFRGISMEGGCYPRGGSIEMAKELVTVIESNGGRVLIRSDVERILYDETIQRVCGVRLTDGKEIHCQRGVISSTGYLNTMNNLIEEKVTTKYAVPRTLPVAMSSGFVMANIGIDCPASFIGASSSNTWHIPLDKHGDIFPALEEYFQDPLKKDCPISAFISFPSLKDITHKDKEKTSCQILIMAEYDWFVPFVNKKDNANGNGYEMKDSADRKEGYDAVKEMWKERCVAIFLKYFPKAAEHIAMVDISTPLTIQHYLKAPHGGAVGLDVTPERFTNKVIRENLDPISKIPGLALTGQDVALCGVTLCQVTGIITAFRLEGIWAAMKIVLQSIILGDNKK